jgi:signal transduction histidine kinase
MQKQKENIALKKANLSKEIKIQNKNYFLVAFIVLLVLTIYLLWMIFKRGRRMDKNNIVLTQQNEEINRQKKELEELNQWKSIFFSIVSHDLRSPILSLKGMLDLYHSNLLDEEELKLFMQELNKNFKNTASLMDNLLMWAKSQMQGQKLDKEEIDIYQITKDNIEVLQQKIDEKKLNFKNNIHIRFAYADEESISIVIRNLIANAIKFSKSGDEIIINSEKKGNNLIFCIKDNGLGMSLEQVTKVLSRVFYTTSGTKEEKGTGLGILLCDEFVRKNGGEFWIKSILGEGSSFYFSLPLRK